VAVADGLEAPLGPLAVVEVGGDLDHQASVKEVGGLDRLTGRGAQPAGLVEPPPDAGGPWPRRAG
jgi:hypothetical protein